MCAYYNSNHTGNDHIGRQHVKKASSNNGNNNRVANKTTIESGGSNVFHVDIHGKQNDGESDLDLGLYCIAYDIDKRQTVRDALSFELNKIFKV